MLKHDFYQVAPKVIRSMSEDQICDYIISHKGILPCLSLADSMVRRNLGRIDNRQFNAFDLSTYAKGKMKIFSDFVNTHAEIQIIGINYYGITILDSAILKTLADYHKRIHLIDFVSIEHFIRYCKNALEHEKWVVHYGV